MAQQRSYLFLEMYYARNVKGRDLSVLMLCASDHFLREPNKQYKYCFRNLLSHKLF